MCRPGRCGWQVSSPWRRRAGEGGTDGEDGLGFAPRLLVVLLAQRDELLGERLGLFGLGPRRRQRLAREEGVDEVAEQLPPLLGVAAEFSVGGHGEGGSFRVVGRGWESLSQWMEYHSVEQSVDVVGCLCRAAVARSKDFVVVENLAGFTPRADMNAF
jgi:hypothetical protein